MKNLLVSFLSLVIFSASNLIAQEIEINVHTKAEPKGALGIFFSNGKVVQQPNTNFERVNEETVVVRMPYEVSELPSASPFATAYVLTSDNQIVFGDVRLVRASDSADSFIRLPICKQGNTKSKAQIPLPEQLNYLESLLQVRLKKREVIQKGMSDKMTPEFVERLEKLEKGFGLSSETPLSAELSGLELVGRLSRLKDAINLYRGVRENAKAPDTAPPQ